MFGTSAHAPAARVSTIVGLIVLLVFPDVLFRHSARFYRPGVPVQPSPFTLISVKPSANKVRAAK